MINIYNAEFQICINSVDFHGYVLSYRDVMDVKRDLCDYIFCKFDKNTCRTAVICQCFAYMIHMKLFIDKSDSYEEVTLTKGEVLHKLNTAYPDCVALVDVHPTPS